MANPSVVNVQAALPAITGGISAAILGTALPADSSTVLVAAFKGLGFVGDGGLTNTPTRSMTPIKEWGGNTVANLQTDYSEVFTFTFLESLNPDVVKAVFGDANVTVTAAAGAVGNLLAVKRNALLPVKKVWSFDMFAGLGKRRILVPIGDITIAGDITYTSSNVVSYPVTLTAYPDATGNTSYEYSTDGVTGP